MCDRSNDHSEYILHHFCDDDMNDPDILKQANLLANRIRGVPGPDLPKAELCTFLRAEVQHLDDPDAKQGACAEGIALANRVTVRHRGELKCYDIIDLQNRINQDPKFAASFSTHQKYKIARKFKTAQAYAQLSCSIGDDGYCLPPPEIPCRDLSGNRELCYRNPLCTYGLKPQGRYVFKAKECSLKPYVLGNVSKTCSYVDINVLRTVILQTYLKYIYHPVYLKQNGLSKRRQAAIRNDQDFLADRIDAGLRSFHREYYCAWIYDRANGDPSLLTWQTRNSERLLFIMGQFTVSSKFILNLTKYINMPFRASKNNADTLETMLTVLVNFYFFAENCIYLTFVELLALFPSLRLGVRSLFGIGQERFAVLWLMSLSLLSVDPKLAVSSYFHMARYFDQPVANGLTRTLQMIEVNNAVILKSDYVVKKQIIRNVDQVRDALLNVLKMYEK